MGFNLLDLQVRAYQGGVLAYQLLSRITQLNCLMGMSATGVICGLDGDELLPQAVFLLKPMVVFVRRDKMTCETLESIHYWAHRQFAKQTFHSLKTMNPEELEEVAWRQIYNALYNVPRLFQLWAYKKVMGVAGTKYNLVKRKKGRTWPMLPKLWQGDCCTAMKLAGWTQ